MYKPEQYLCSLNNRYLNDVWVLRHGQGHPWTLQSRCIAPKRLHILPLSSRGRANKEVRADACYQEWSLSRPAEMLSSSRRLGGHLLLLSPWNSDAEGEDVTDLYRDFGAEFFLDLIGPKRDLITLKDFGHTS